VVSLDTSSAHASAAALLAIMRPACAARARSARAARAVYLSRYTIVVSSILTRVAASVRARGVRVVHHDTVYHDYPSPPAEFVGLLAPQQNVSVYWHWCSK
jgi:hypothetical protein